MPVQYGGSGSSVSSVLTSGIYNPNTLVTYTTMGQTFTAIDATNIKAAFTAPASGNVQMHLQIYCNGTSAPAYPIFSVALTGPGGPVSTTMPGNPGTTALDSSIIYRITGMTAGGLYTATPNFASSNNVSNCSAYAGNGAGAPFSNYAGPAVWWVISL